MRNKNPFLQLPLLAGTVAFFGTAFLSLHSLSTAFADEPTAVASPQIAEEQSAEAISDWALAGVVWSDASLTKKLAIDALRQEKDEQQVARLRKLVAESDQIVQSLEKFGWKQVRSAPEPTGGRPGTAAIDQKPPLSEGLKKLDEVSPTVAQELAEAREQGIDAAVAATRSSGIPGPEPGAGRISQREVQTRSDTLPYSNESIYDADDYDPNIDYQVDNPLAAESVDPRVADPIDDIKREEIRQLETNDAIEVSPVAPAASTEAVIRPTEIPNPLAARSDLNRYTTDAARHQQDAAWVQLRLDENQMKYRMLSRSESAGLGVTLALRQLQTTAMVAGRATDSESLQAVLKPILDLSTSQ